MTLAEWLVRLCELLLRDCRAAGGTRVVLDVLADGSYRASHRGPRSRLPSDPLDDEPWRAVLSLAASWSVETQADDGTPRRVLRGEGGRLTSPWETGPPWPGPGALLQAHPDSRRVEGELQEPSVLFALRELASRSVEAGLVVRLPSGTRW